MKHRSTPRLRAAVAFALACAAAHLAAAAPPLTLDAAIDLALRANPSLRAAGHEVLAQEGALAQAGASPNPELELLREGDRGDSRTTTATLNIPIELGGKRAARIAAARQQGRLATLALEAERDRVRLDTAAAYYDVVAAIERERMAQELLALAGRALAAAGQRVAAGTLSPVEETRARVAQGSARIEALQAARDLDGARILLAAMWAADASAAAQLDIAAPSAVALPAAVPLDRLLARLETAPAMRQARAQVEHRQALARSEQARRTPDVTVIVGAQREGPDVRNRAVLGLSVPLPLFNRNDGAVLEALRRVDQARNQADADSVRLRADLAQAHARLVAALGECELIEAEILPGAEDAQRAASRGFELGKFGLIDVLDAQRVLAQSKNQYWNAVVESHRAALDIARLLGSAAVQEKP